MRLTDLQVLCAALISAPTWRWSQMSLSGLLRPSRHLHLTNAFHATHTKMTAGAGAAAVPVGALQSRFAPVFSGLRTLVVSLCKTVPDDFLSTYNCLTVSSTSYYIKRGRLLHHVPQFGSKNCKKPLVCGRIRLYRPLRMSNEGLRA